MNNSRYHNDTQNYVTNLVRFYGDEYIYHDDM